jgi:hypothetical protein
MLLLSRFYVWCFVAFATLILQVLTAPTLLANDNLKNQLTAGNTELENDNVKSENVADNIENVGMISSLIFSCGETHQMPASGSSSWL